MAKLTWTGNVVILAGTVIVSGSATAGEATIASRVTMAIQANASFTHNVASAISGSALIFSDNLTAFERI